MSRFLMSLPPLLAAFLLIQCTDPGGTGPGKMEIGPLTPAEKAVVSGGNAFGFKLFASLAGTDVGVNTFISPLSVSMALGMTLNGANGQTRDAIQRTLGFSGITEEEINQSYAALMTGLMHLDPKVQMEIANSIWYDPVLIVEPTFKTINARYFNAEVNGINFADPSAPTTINDWVRRNTNGKITAIVPDPIRPGMVMYLIDAVYFKASWTYRFDTSATVDDFFTRADGSKIPCRMMSQRATYPFLIAGDVRGIDLPYGDAGFSMTIILPPPGVDIDVFIANLTVDQWESWTGRLSSREVTLSMPKFRIEYAVKLNDALLALGMGVAFSNVADFTRIDRRGSLKITEVQHKSFVQVDEEGTEAAAVTSVGFEVTAGSGEHLALRLDRPFIYAIRENTSGTILFIGKMAEPKW